MKAHEDRPVAQLCVICRRAHSGSFACGSCIGRLSADLRAVPELAFELEVTRCRLDNLGVDPGKSYETRLVWSESASEAIYVLANTLGTWARDLWETNGSDQFPAELNDSPASLAMFLLRYPTRLAGHPAIDELDDEVRSAVKLARHTIDRPHDTRIFLGRCSLDDPENGDCERELYAHRSQEEVTCMCGATWSVVQRRDWLLAQAEHETATAATLAGLLTRLGVEVTAKDIQDAGKRGALIPAWIDPHRRRMYRVSDVLDHCLPERVA